MAVLAGPGTGKTHTLVERVVWLVEERGAKPSELTAVTFTNRAAGELRARLEGRLGKRAARAMTIGTFHAICLELLGDVPLAGPYEQRAAPLWRSWAGRGATGPSSGRSPGTRPERTAGTTRPLPSIRRSWRESWTLTTSCWRPCASGRAAGRTGALPTCW